MMARCFIRPRLDRRLVSKTGPPAGPVGLEAQTRAVHARALRHAAPFAYLPGLLFCVMTMVTNWLARFSGVLTKRRLVRPINAISAQIWRSTRQLFLSQWGLRAISRPS